MAVLRSSTCLSRAASGSHPEKIPGNPTLWLSGSGTTTTARGQVVPVTVGDRPADLALEGFDERASRNRLFAKLEFLDGSDYHESMVCHSRSEAKETAPILPVDDATVDATLPYMLATVADMVRLQRLTGMRPGEVCVLRPGDLDRTSDVWIYVPGSHKTEHHGRQRIVCVGPKGQDVLRPYLLRPDDSYCFCPRESEKRRRRLAHEARQTPIGYGNRPGTNRKLCPKRYPGKHYTNDSYRRAVHRAVDKANEARQTEGIEPIAEWSPSQLRHTTATEIRKRYGLEASQVILGHANADVTQVYAERDLQKATEIMREVG